MNQFGWKLIALNLNNGISREICTSQRLFFNICDCYSNAMVQVDMGVARGRSEVLRVIITEGVIVKCYYVPVY